MKVLFWSIVISLVIYVPAMLLANKWVHGKFFRFFSQHPNEERRKIENYSTLCFFFICFFLSLFIGMMFTYTYKIYTR